MHFAAVIGLYTAVNATAPGKPKLKSHQVLQMYVHMYQAEEHSDCAEAKCHQDADASRDM